MSDAIVIFKFIGVSVVPLQLSFHQIMQIVRAWGRNLAE
jgi:hypothetical protein